MRNLIGLVILAACDPAADSAGGGDPTDEDPVGGAEPWQMCVEEGREPVTDPSAVPEGFAVSPQAIVEANAGAWAGAWGRYGDDAALELEVELVFDGAISAVWLVPNEGTSSGGTELLGAPATTGASCSPYYELGGTMSLWLPDGTLDEVVAFTGSASAADDLSVGADIAEEDLNGTARSTMDGEWEDVHLAVWMNRSADGMLSGSMQFSGQSPVDPDAGPDGVVSAFVEPFGSFALARTAP